MSMHTPGTERERAPHAAWLFVTASLLLYLALVWREAWLNEDCFITLRTVRQWHAGNGLVWNPGQRVQAYTHPLWMMLLAGGYFLTTELYYTTLAISALVSLLTALALVRLVATSVFSAALGVVLLLSSQALVDYSTSGLENPLTHLLLVLFVGAFAPVTGGSSPGRRLLVCCALTALVPLCRPDAFLLCAPAAAWTFWETVRRGVSWRRAILLCLLGALPLAGWLVFSVVYYGLPVPMTAIAKLHTDVPPGQLLAQGLYFLLVNASNDPTTLLVILLGVVVPRYLPARTWALSLGMLLHVWYIATIGGDYMLGRFLTPAFVIAVALLVQLPMTPLGAALGTALALILSLTSSRGTLSVSPAEQPTNLGRRINDLRQSHENWTSLRQAPRGVGGVSWKWRTEGEEADPGQVYVRGPVGIFGAYASLDVKVIDEYALCDPLLAYLPPKHDPNWRSGHFRRAIPAGYEESLRNNDNRLGDPKLRQFYDHIRRIVSGPIWSVRRFRSIWKLNRGALAYLVNRQEYKYWQADEYPLPTLAPTSPETPRDGRAMRKEGAKVVVGDGSPSHASHYVVALSAEHHFSLLFERKGEVVGRIMFEPAVPRPEPQVVHRGRVPRHAVETGYDLVRIVPDVPGKEYRIWHLALAKEEVDVARLESESRAYFRAVPGEKATATADPEPTAGAGAGDGNGDGDLTEEATPPEPEAP